MFARITWQISVTRSEFDSRLAVSFPLSTKVDVNCDNTPPVYQYLKQEAPGILGSKRIKWNFTKFLVNDNCLITNVVG